MMNKTDLLEALSSAIVVLDDALHVVYMNAAAEMLSSQSQQRALGAPVSRLFSNRSLNRQLKAARGLSEPHAIRGQRVLLVDGGTITVDCVVTPVQDMDDAVLLLEFQRMDRQLRIVREEQLLHQQQAVHELVRGIAHEIKNPLGGLRGAAQLLELELQDSELKEYTQIIVSEADRLKHLVDGMLGPGKLPKADSVNIHEVLEHVHQLVKIDVAGDDVQFRRDYDPSIPEFMGDRDQLVQVCLNIVNNAVRAVRNHEGAGTVWLRTRVLRQFTINQQRHRLVLRAEICDDGPGIPESLCDKIFLPMVSGHEDGSGLGLSIAQSLLRRHGGLIQCDSEEGRTCFYILIPLENNNDADG